MIINNKKRLFIALNLPTLVKNRLVEVINKLSMNYPGVKWCQSQGLHLTLHFLGEIDKPLEEKIKLNMQSFSGKFGQFSFNLGRINAFPNLIEPRVIFIECNQTNGKSIFKLQSLLAEKLVKLNLEIDHRPWQPHITLGRIKYHINNFKLSNEEIENLAGTTFSIGTMELMESELTTSGAIYKTAISYKL